MAWACVAGWFFLGGGAGGWRGWGMAGTHRFALTVKRARHVVAAPSRRDRDEWILLLRQAIAEQTALADALEGAVPSLAPCVMSASGRESVVGRRSSLCADWATAPSARSPRRVRHRRYRVRSLRLEIIEARNLGHSGDYYAEALLDTVRVAVTAVRKGVAAPYWADVFEFECVCPDAVAVTFTAHACRLTPVRGRPRTCCRRIQGPSRLGQGPPRACARRSAAQPRCRPWYVARHGWLRARGPRWHATRELLGVPSAPCARRVSTSSRL